MSIIPQPRIREGSAQQLVIWGLILSEPFPAPPPPVVVVVAHKMAGAVDREAATSTRKTSRHAHKLCEHSELPQWAHDNAFIISGYRRPGGTNAELQEVEALNVSDRQQREVGSVRRRAKGSQKQTDETSAQAAAPTLFEHNSVRACWESVWLYWHNETGAQMMISHRCLRLALM